VELHDGLDLEAQKGWRFKEEASLTNFLFSSFLIKGLGAEISAAKDCQKFGGRQRFGIRQF
jgi:hypothetical protein